MDLAIFNKQIEEIKRKFICSGDNHNEAIIQQENKKISALTKQLEFLKSKIDSQETIISQLSEFKKRHRYKKVTYDIDRVSINNVTSYPITEIYGMGKITELTIVSSAKPSLEAYIDGRHLFNLSITLFDDLQKISIFSKDITAQTVPPNFVVSVRNLSFSESFSSSIYFTPPANIISIYVKYDLCKDINGN